MDRVRYYLLQRPPTPGNIPTWGLVEAEDYCGIRYIYAIDDVAWGHATYDRILPEDEVMFYELARNEAEADAP